MISSRGPVVLDASLAIKWIRLEAHSDWARGILASGLPLLAPDLFAAECANVLWRMRRRGEADAPDPAVALDRDAALATADIRFAAAIRGAGVLPGERLLTPP